MRSADPCGVSDGFKRCAVMLFAGLACCAGEDPVSPAASTGPFTEISAAAGLDFEYFSGRRAGRFYPCEIMGSGLAWLDYDADGDLDLYVVQGADLDPGSSAAQASPPTDRLFRNDLVLAADGSRRAQFVDVTAASGISAVGFGMGVAAGDYDLTLRRNLLTQDQAQQRALARA